MTADVLALLEGFRNAGDYFALGAKDLEPELLRANIFVEEVTKMFAGAP